MSDLQIAEYESLKRAKEVAEVKLKSYKDVVEAITRKSDEYINNFYLDCKCLIREAETREYNPNLREISISIQLDSSTVFMIINKNIEDIESKINELNNKIKNI